MYMGFLPALLPVIALNLELDYKAVGLLVSMVTVFSQFSQPLFGFLGDRLGRRWLTIVAPAVTALSVSFIGLAGSYGLLLALLIVGSASTSAFHPQGAALTGALARPRSGLAMAIFTAGGNTGFGLGAVLIAAVVAALGPTRTWVTLPGGLAAAVFLALAIPRSVESSHAESLRRTVTHRTGWQAPLFALYWVVMLRAATATMFTTFVPMLINRRGEALLLGGYAILGFSLAGAVGGFVGGRLSEIIGRRAVTAAGFGLTAPCLYLFLHSEGLLAGVLVFLTGAFLFSALPVNIVMAQELLPRHASTVSGVVMGFAWGVGGLGATGLGALADHWSITVGELEGLARALDLVPLVCLLAAAVGLALPRETARTQGMHETA
jgi:FSR family fosmidomycin resistance protein-like MFS transporter